MQIENLLNDHGQFASTSEDRDALLMCCQWVLRDSSNVSKSLEGGRSKTSN
jgi:hypothetical protein